MGMKNFMLSVMLAVLLPGALGMETADEANSSKRKRNIGRAGTSPALPPNSNESPGGGVYTPGGSNLSGALGMETADEANSSKRKRYIGRAGNSPALPPNSIESPGGGVYTPGGSNLFRMEREVGRGNRREKVTLFGKPGVARADEAL